MKERPLPRPAEVREYLRTFLAPDGVFLELRYQARRARQFRVEKGRVESAQVRHRAGVGVRVLEGGSRGFASTGSLEAADIRRAIDAARAAARLAAGRRRDAAPPPAPASLARGDFTLPGVDDVESISMDAKLDLVRRMEVRARAAGERIRSAASSYTEVFEDRAIVTSDGASASFRLVRPEFAVNAVAGSGGDLMTANRSVGVTGAWDCLFRDRTGESMAEDAARTATDLLSAPRPDGGRATVILSPSIVGLLVHEAVGHTVEADFVQSGSVASGKIGERVASECVTIADSGASEHHPGAGGSLPVDDEGVPAGRTIIIENGVLRSYLHDRESAARFGVAPTGNARAYDYSDVPLIRMRNTWLAPGTDSLDAMIAGISDGYFLDGPRNGQADATGEFMFGVERAWRIRNGRLEGLVRGATISGIAFDVLSTVDAVSRDFRWDLGSGHCGKGQPAKVDAGGPYIRCRATLGGVQA